MLKIYFKHSQWECYSVVSVVVWILKVRVSKEILRDHEKINEQIFASNGSKYVCKQLISLSIGTSRSCWLLTLVFKSYLPETAS